jgi:hypothetical protein
MARRSFISLTSLACGKRHKDSTSTLAIGEQTRRQRTRLVGKLGAIAAFALGAVPTFRTTSSVPDWDTPEKFPFSPSNVMESCAALQSSNACAEADGKSAPVAKAVMARAIITSISS